MIFRISLVVMVILLSLAWSFDFVLKVEDCDHRRRCSSDRSISCKNSVGNDVILLTDSIVVNLELKGGINVVLRVGKRKDSNRTRNPSR